MSKITIAQLGKLSGISEYTLHKWTGAKRLALTTKYAQPVCGPAQGGRFSIENATEIMLIAAQIRAGINPSLAAARTGTVFKNWKRGQSRQWTIFLNAASFEDVICIERVTAEQLQLLKDNFVFMCVNTGALIAQVERFFEAQETAEVGAA